jgi:hypothetical protein
VRGQRPRRRRAAKKRDECAPLHVRPKPKETPPYRLKQTPDRAENDTRGWGTVKQGGGWGDRRTVTFDRISPGRYPDCVAETASGLFECRFARRPRETRDVGLRDCEAGRIDRRGERRFAEPPHQPSAELLPLKAQRRPQERFGKPLALQCVEPLPSLQSCRNQIDAPHMRAFSRATLSKRKHENKKPKYSQEARSRGPRVFQCDQRDPKFSGGCAEAEARSGGLRCDLPHGTALLMTLT